ncbi:MAG: hypothetical protein KAU49_04655, partial [Candidatus Krumholzibacteria bacterium]|nr:hypothetical protein [Candidatus Krumholzibacteria bacterium]
IVAAGNGPVVRGSPARFGRSADLTVITDDLFIVRESSAYLEPPAATYLGVLEDRPATIRLVSEISPDVMIADFDMPARELSNPLDAFIRKTVMPLERLAAAALSARSRLVLISRGGNHRNNDVRRAALLGETLVRNLFRDAEDRLLIIRTDGAVGTASLAHAAGQLSGTEGTVWETRVRGGAGETRLEPVETGRVPDDVSNVLMEISRALAGGEAARVSGILLDFTNSIGVEEHESG